MTYIIISKRMEKQRSKTMLKKNSESTIPSPINVASTCLFKFILGNEQFGYTFCYLVDLKFDHYSSLVQKKKLVPVHAYVVRSLLSNLDCVCWYYHSSSCDAGKILLQ